jgi:hypothetical protein
MKNYVENLFIVMIAKILYDDGILSIQPTVTSAAFSQI